MSFHTPDTARSVAALLVLLCTLSRDAPARAQPSSACETTRHSARVLSTRGLGAGERVVPTDGLDSAWSELLAAMARGDGARLAALSTASPRCRPLSEVPGGPAGLARAAATWCAAGVTWQDVHHADAGDAEVDGLVGPPRPAMTGVCFTREDGLWRFAGWQPGG